MPRRILLVEDEPGLRLTLTGRLASEGYLVEQAPDGETGLHRAAGESFDLIILLPDRSGFEVCRDLRRRGVDTPILMLTARGQVEDRVLGLRLGADDYLVKPFAMSELLARVEARLRREPEPPPPVGDAYRFGEVDVDFRKAEVQRAGRPVDLSAKSSDCCATWCASAAPPFPGTSSSTRCGATTPCRPPAPWTCTWPACAASWSLTRTIPSTSSPSTGSGTSSSAEVRPDPCRGTVDSDLRHAGFEQGHLSAPQERGALEVRGGASTGGRRRVGSGDVDVPPVRG